jgi:hypothetical protein
VVGDHRGLCSSNWRVWWPRSVSETLFLLLNNVLLATTAATVLLGTYPLLALAENSRSVTFQRGFIARDGAVMLFMVRSSCDSLEVTFCPSSKLKSPACLLRSFLNSAVYRHLVGVDCHGFDLGVMDHPFVGPTDL